MKNEYKDKALALFIGVSDIKILEERLRKRSTENEESLQVRLKKAAEEMTYSKEFDKIIINDILEQAVDECYRKVREFVGGEE